MNRATKAIGWMGVVIVMIFLIALLACAPGCLSAFERHDLDIYQGQTAEWNGNGRTTEMGPATQPTAPEPVAVSPIVQRVPDVGVVFILRVDGKAYEAMKKTDGKIYVIKEAKP